MYNGNANLRHANDKIIYTDDMKVEFVKCMSDILYFGEKYCNIISVDKGKILIKFWEFQKRMLKAMYKSPEYRNEDGELEQKQNLVVLCPRQAGKCINYWGKIRIRNKNTGKIVELSIGQFHEMIKPKIK